MLSLSLPACLPACQPRHLSIVCAQLNLTCTKSFPAQDIVEPHFQKGMDGYLARCGLSFLSHLLTSDDPVCSLGKKSPEWATTVEWMGSSGRA